MSLIPTLFPDSLLSDQELTVSLSVEIIPYE